MQQRKMAVAGGANDRRTIAFAFAFAFASAFAWAVAGVAR